MNSPGEAQANPLDQFPALPLSDAPTGQREPLQRDRGERLCDRPGCRKELSGRKERWCSETCRWKAWDAKNPRQKPLDFAPPAAPLPPVQDQRLDLAEEGKLRGDNALVLRRLRQGPATTVELQAAAPRSMAVHSRVADVRAYLLPLGETVRRRQLGPRLHLYWIEAVR